MRRPLHVMAIPVARDQLIPYLEEGRGDIAAASLTITPERSEKVDFSIPGADEVSEVVVTGPGSPAVATLDDLAGKEVFIRPSSSYQESLEMLNAAFRERGLEEIVITPVSEYLETEDLLEMVNAGLIGITIADDYLADFWAQVLPDLVVHTDVAVRTGQKIGWAIRRDATGLKAQVDQFAKTHRSGTLLGNMLIKRYLQDTKFVKNALADGERQQAPGDRRPVPQVRRPIRLRLPDGGRPGLPGIGAGPERRQSGGRPRHHAGDADDRGRQVGRHSRYLDPRQQHPRRHQVPPLHRRQLLRRPRHRRGQPHPLCLRLLQRGAEPHPAACAKRQRAWDSTPTFGSETSRWSWPKNVGREPVQYVSNIYKYYTVYSMLQDQREIKQELKDEMKDGN